LQLPLGQTATLAYLANIITSLPAGGQSVVIHLSVCLSVLLHVSKTAHPNFTKLSEHVTCVYGLFFL